ncbi:MAG: SPOR domain-containing protein [Candidatus Marinimicrobia bacterium]|nr:SPOR domain-containing protein [Candidatus Neomarinimicrobiota bacterium]
MMKKIILILLGGFSIVFAQQAFDIQEIMKGEDSGELRKYLNVYKEYASNDKNVQLLDIVLDTDGLSAARKAQDYIRKYGTEAESNWALLLLADYYLSSGNRVLAEGLLEKALLRDSYISEDRYFMLLESRLVDNLPDLATAPQDKNPSKIILNLNEANKILSEREVLSHYPTEETQDTKETPKLDVPTHSLPYHLQVGAFSQKSNAEELRNFFVKEGFPVSLRVRATENGTLYVVWVGNYKDRESAQNDRKYLLDKYQSDSFIVKE